MMRLIVLVALLASPTLTKDIERRRAFYRRTTTTTAAPAVEDTVSSETKFKENNGEGLYTVGDSFAISGSPSSSSSGDSVGKGSAFKPVTSSSDKQTSFSEYNFGGTKLSDTSDSDSDEDYGLSISNHKPLQQTSNGNSYKSSGAFDFLNNDYSKPSFETKPKSSYTSKFSISHPNPSKSSYPGKLDHLDDSTEYDIYSNLKSGNSYRSPLQNYVGQTISPYSQFSGSSFDGKVKKLPNYGYDDSGQGSHSTKNKKNKLSLDDDTFGGSNPYGNSNFGVGKLEHPFSSGGKKKNPYGFGEPPLVKSAISTLKNFGEGLLGNPGKASSSYYDTDSEEGGFGNSKFKQFGKGSNSFKSSYNLDSSDESDEIYAKPKIPKLHSSYGTKPQKPVTIEYESDFDVKNIKLPAAHNKFRPHTHTNPTQHKTKLYGSNIDNPNPLEFRPNFKLQDVPNLYPDEHIGASIAAKGQIENFLNSEHSFKNEPIRTTHFIDGNPGKKGSYQQFLKAQEDEKIEKEALKAQIEYLKAQAVKRPNEQRQRPSSGSNSHNSNPHGHGPHGQRGRPIRRIPNPLGVKGPHPAPRIPHYNDRPYSVSFKL